MPSERDKKGGENSFSRISSPGRDDGDGGGTYEAMMARQSTSSMPDKIAWDSTKAFRDSPYRHLHHQRGLMGVFRVRLLEASDLQRSYWSALALGPVKHLGFSKAHGAVSSYCSFSLDFAYLSSNGRSDSDGGDTYYTGGSFHRSDSSTSTSSEDKKPAAQPKPVFTSPVIECNNSPVWDNCQFDCPLRKGVIPSDGMRILLNVRVDEDSTAIENFLPGVPSGGDSRLLGQGFLDLTELCLGETTDGQPLPGVRDAWIPISLNNAQEEEQKRHTLQHQHQQNLEASLYNPNDPLAPPSIKKTVSTKDAPSSNSSSSVTGMVRVLVSYQPYGFEPQAHDLVALEAFARRNPFQNSCRPLLKPLQALTVLERRGAYLLCEYKMNDGRIACIRLHRNAVFVIERKNVVDAAHNLVLLPIDLVASTPLGRAAGSALGPIVAAGKEVLLPALLSLKLVWVAARTTTLAGLSGVNALGQTLWSEGSASLTASHRDSSRHMYRDEQGRDAARSTATAQFVSL